MRLAAHTAAGLGAVCRRQNTTRFRAIVSLFAGEPPLDGFGIKMTGLAAYGPMLASDDSMTWSLDARRSDCCPVTRTGRAATAWIAPPPTGGPGGWTRPLSWRSFCCDTRASSGERDNGRRIGQ